MLNISLSPKCAHTHTQIHEYRKRHVQTSTLGGPMQETHCSVTLKACDSLTAPTHFCVHQHRKDIQANVSQFYVRFTVYSWSHLTTCNVVYVEVSQLSREFLRSLLLTAHGTCDCANNDNHTMIKAFDKICRHQEHPLILFTYSTPHSEKWM